MDTTFTHLRLGFLARLSVNLRLAMSFALQRVMNAWRLLGHLFFHLLLYRGTTGEVFFNVEPHEADGFVRHMVRGDDGVMRMHTTTFVIYNRWLARKGMRPAPRLLWAIKTEAETAFHLRVHTVVWGMESWERVEVSPFDLSRLPSEEEILAQNARRRRVQDFFAKHFPAKPVHSGLTREDVAESILFR